MDARPIITLTTDFGQQSPYVAEMKGVILARNSDARIVDVTHAVPPQDIVHGAFVVDQVVGSFPPGAIHVVVVDPTVGTSRRIVAVRAADQFFIAPDNGVLTQIADRFQLASIVSLDEPEFWQPVPSRTFHGRDIMAPVAAHLSLGVPLDRLGSTIDDIVTLGITSARMSDHRIEGEIVFSDSFGNLITNIRGEHLDTSDRRAVTVTCRRHEIQGVCNTYADRLAGDLIALIGSSSRLEIAIVNGSAKKRLQVGAGQNVVVTW